MRSATIVVLIALSVALAPPVAAQVQKGTASASATYKDPGTATVVGVFVPGGGQMYSGETTKGLTLLGIGWGSLLAGEVLTYGNCARGTSCSVAPMAAGALVYLGTWIYGMADAGDSARRHNAAAGLKTVNVQPTVRSMGDRGAGVGVTLQF